MKSAHSSHRVQEALEMMTNGLSAQTPQCASFFFGKALSHRNIAWRGAKNTGTMENGYHRHSDVPISPVTVFILE